MHATKHITTKGIQCKFLIFVITKQHSCNYSKRNKALFLWLKDVPHKTSLKVAMMRRVHGSTQDYLHVLLNVFASECLCSRYPGHWVLHQHPESQSGQRGEGRQKRMTKEGGVTLGNSPSL